MKISLFSMLPYLPLLIFWAWVGLGASVLVAIFQRQLNKINGFFIGLFGVLAIAASIDAATGRFILQSYFTSIFHFDPKHPIIFTEFYFWLFFAFVMCVFSVVQQKRVARSTFLFAVSIFFYWKTSGMFFLLLIFATVLDYFIGIALDNAQRRIDNAAENGFLDELKKKAIIRRNTILRKSLVGGSIFINLGNLMYFKYAFFFTDAYNKIFQTDYKVINWLAHWSNQYFHSTYDIWDILLPVGVSFFTFQSISYSVEVYRKHISPVRNILDFGFYVSYFPQLVAGPIVKANEFVPQIYQPYRLTRFEFGIAVFWILNGLIKKLVIGDYLAVNFIDRVFDYPENYTGFGVLWALLFYSLQVYADFSGYTDIAIGVSLFLGFRLPMNFNSPYKAKNVGEFWRRWHMSLSNWLKDYLYIPLGGNKKGSFGTFFWSFIILVFVILITDDPVFYSIIAGSAAALLLLLAWLIKPIRSAITTNINLMITMVLGGLWHGASWNFLIWGALNGAALVFFKTWSKWKPGVKVAVFSVLLAAFSIYAYLYQYLFGETSMSFVDAVSTHAGIIGIVVAACAVIPFFIYYLFIKIIRVDTMQMIAAWGIFITFIFISFTRLFFRAGDRKNTGNGMETVQRMWKQLMTNWDWDAVVKILENHWGVFVMFVIGMVIHWLPVKVKEWYRTTFANLPYAAQVGVVVVSVIVILQFISSELQSFIYFQF